MNTYDKITIVQARMSSTRLPGKIMKSILGKSVLEHQLERMSYSQNCGQIIVATSTNPKDDILELFCKEKGIEIFRGDENDLLDRHYQCAMKYQAKVIAKIPSDCPLIDYRIIDEVFEEFDSNNFDFYSNLHPATYPDGNDVEIFTIDALTRAVNEASRTLEREHTTPYFWENKDKFTQGNFVWDSGMDYSMSHRFTIDYQEDFDFIEAVFNHLYPMNAKFSLDDILELLENNPEIYELNVKFVGVNWYRNHLDELNSINENNTKQI